MNVMGKMAQLDVADSMTGNWLGLGLGLKLGLGLVNNNLKVKLLKVGLVLSWPGIELAALSCTRPFMGCGVSNFVIFFKLRCFESSV